MATEVLRDKSGAIPPEHWDGEPSFREKRGESYSPEFLARQDAHTEELRKVVERTKAGHAAVAAPVPPPTVPPKGSVP